MEKRAGRTTECAHDWFTCSLNMSAKWQRSGYICRRHTSTQVERDGLQLRQDQRATDQEVPQGRSWEAGGKAQCKYEEHMMAVSTHACDIQERTSIGTPGYPAPKACWPPSQ